MWENIRDSKDKCKMSQLLSQDWGPWGLPLRLETRWPHKSPLHESEQQNQGISNSLSSRLMISFPNFSVRAILSISYNESSLLPWKRSQHMQMNFCAGGEGQKLQDTPWELVFKPEVNAWPKKLSHCKSLLQAFILFQTWNLGLWS